MPRFRRYRKRPVRRPRQRRARFSRKKRRMDKPETLKLLSPAQIVPDRYFLKQTYTKVYSPAGGALIIADQYQLALNSVYGCDVTGSNSHEAMGFTQLGTFYASFRVWASTVLIEASTGGATNPCTLAIFPSNSIIVPTANDLEYYISQPYAKYQLMGPGGGTSRSILRQHMSTKKMFGYKSIDQEDDFAGGAATPTQPNNLGIWNIVVYANDGVHFEANDFQWVAKVTYYVEYYNRLQLSQA